MRVHQIESNAGGKAAERKAKRAAPRQTRPIPTRRVTFGVIVGNRGFFPGHLAREGREEMLRALEEEGYDAVVLGADATNYGAIESRDEAKAYADLFKRNRDAIDGIVVTLPNFGDERGVAETLRLAGLNVPVLIHASMDDPAKMGIDNRRDAFCGKMSVCNVLTQYGIPYSLTSVHTQRPESTSFRADLRQFAAVCRVVRGLRGLRIGAIGARPAAFKTVRYSEKILEASGIAVEPIDLSEILGRIERLKDNDAEVVRKLDEIGAYVTTDGVPPTALVKMAKLGLVIDRWMKEADVTVSAVQCWTSMEEYFGVVPCTVMSMMSNANLPSACEVDVCGTLSMYALTLASETPSGAARLEQQLRRRSRQGRLLPLQQPAEGLLRRHQDGLPGDHRRHGRPREHLRHGGRQGEGGGDELRALLDRRPHGKDSRLRRRRASSPRIRCAPSAARAW